MSGTSNLSPVSSTWISWLLVLFAAAAIRLGASSLFFGDLEQDPDAYRALAESWSESGIYGLRQADGQVHPTAFRPPLYPWVLSWGVVGNRLQPIWVVLVHLVCGLATVSLTMHIASMVSKSHRWLAEISGLLVAMDPILVKQSTLIMTETMATLLAVWTWWLWVVSFPKAQPKLSRWSAWIQPASPLLIGLSLGVGALCRPSGLVWGVGIVLFAPWFVSPSWKRGFANGAQIALGVLLCLGPWTFRNWNQLGHPIWMTTHGGYTLLLANNPFLYEHIKREGASRHWDPRPFHQEWGERPKVPEWEDDLQAQRRASKTIQEQPSLFFLACFVRTSWLWAWWPAEGSANLKWIVGTWYALFSMIVFKVIVYDARQWRSRAELLPWLPPLLLALSLTAIHSIYWSNMRMRAPIMPPFYVLTAIGLVTSYAYARTKYRNGA